MRALVAGFIVGLDYIAPDLRPLAVPIETLTPDPNNARQHDVERDVPVLMESLRRFGQRKPIVVRRVGDRVVVIAGNGTLTAAARLGWSHLAVAHFDGTDDEARAYALADNRTAELSTWDYEVLAGQLAALRDLDVGLPEALGWSEEALGPLLAAEWTPPAREALPSTDDDLRTVTLTAAQYGVVKQAINGVKRLEGGDLSDGRCLELLAADWLSGSPPQ